MLLPRLYSGLQRPASIARGVCQQAALSSRQAAGAVIQSRVAELASLERLYEALCERIACYASCHPEVAGVLTLRKRAEKDLQYIRSLSSDEGDTLESARNNAAGLNSELDVVRGVAPLCSLYLPSCACTDSCVWRPG